MHELDEKSLRAVNGGSNYMNVKLPKLKSSFEAACKSKNMTKIMSILPELQARGEYGWARDTAHKYGINSI